MIYSAENPYIVSRRGINISSSKEEWCDSYRGTE